MQGPDLIGASLPQNRAAGADLLFNPCVARVTANRGLQIALVDS